MSGVSSVNRRKPLDLLQKWRVAQYWAQQDPPLKRTSFAVLMRLLDRQNIKNGRCDPSAVGIAEETGFSERGVRGAFNELETRGAIKRFRKARRARNQFLIFSVEEVGQNKFASELKPRAGQQFGLKPASHEPATRFRSNLQRTSPETIKEQKKKKKNAEKTSAFDCGSGLPGQASHPVEIGLGEFEKRMVKVFEKAGFGYTGLLELPSQAMEQAHGRFLTGEDSFSTVAGSLLDELRALKRPHAGRIGSTIRE